MSDRRGDDTKRVPGCTEANCGGCEHLKETSSPTDFDGETYDCAICGEHYRLHYEDMA